jgi:hypothetical protein
VLARGSADWITAFAGPMPFIYLHVALFAIWMLSFGSNPWQMQALSDFQQAKADHDFNEQEFELKTNTELTREIHTLTVELDHRLMGRPTPPH